MNAQFALTLTLLAIPFALWMYRRWSAESKAVKAYNQELDEYEGRKHNFYVIAENEFDKSVKSRAAYHRAKLEESGNILYKKGQLQVEPFPIRYAGENYFETYAQYLVRIGQEVMEIEIKQSGERHKVDPEGWEETIYGDEKEINSDGEWNNKKFKKGAFRAFGF